MKTRANEIPRGYIPLRDPHPVNRVFDAIEELLRKILRKTKVTVLSVQKMVTRFGTPQTDRKAKNAA